MTDRPFILEASDAVEERGLAYVLRQVALVCDDYAAELPDGNHRKEAWAIETAIIRRVADGVRV